MSPLIRRIIIPVSVPLLLAAAPATQPTASMRPAPQLVAAMFSALRQPAANEFATPESVVHFLLLQVQKQDLDEATKAYPVAEYYRARTFERTTGYIRVIDPRSTPFPNFDFHNASIVFGQLGHFDQLGLALLGVDPGRMTPLHDPNSTAEIPALAARYDPRRLSTMQVGPITSAPVPVAPRDVISQSAGVTARAEVTATVTDPAGKPRRCKFLTEQIGTNWRLSPAQVLPDISN